MRSTRFHPKHRSLGSLAWMASAGLLVALSLGAAPAAAQAQIAVLPVLGYGVPSDKVAELEKLVEPAVQAAAGNVLPSDETLALLEAAEEAAGCVRTEQSCLLEIGGLMAVNRVVVVRAKAHPKGIELEISVIDIVAGHEDRRVQGVIARTGAPPADQIRSLVFRLFHDSMARLGGLIVEVAEEGATILVDGEVRGTSPLPGPVYGLSVGEHVVRAELEGVDPLEKTVEIRSGQTLQISIRLGPDPEAESGIAPVAIRTFGWGTITVGTLTSGGAGLVALMSALASATIILLNQATLADYGTVFGRCYFGAPCDVKQLQKLRDPYVNVALPTWVATTIGAPATLLAMFGLGMVAAGVGVLIFVATGDPEPVADVQPAILGE